MSRSQPEAGQPRAEKTESRDKEKGDPQKEVIIVIGKNNMKFIKKHKK